MNEDDEKVITSWIRMNGKMVGKLLLLSRREKRRSAMRKITAMMISSGRKTNRKLVVSKLQLLARRRKTRLAKSIHRVRTLSRESSRYGLFPNKIKQNKKKRKEKEKC
jgi:cell division inhibitor SulA